MNMKIIFFALVLFYVQSSTYAAGFNCAVENLNDTEKTICQNPYLNGIDNVTNKLFTSAINNTLSVGSVKSSQLDWLKERNTCRKNVACIKDHYIKRNAELSLIQGFHSVSEVFTESLIDAPFNREIINDNGFTIRDNHWVLKKLLSNLQIEQDLKIKDGYWSILSHIEVNNDLVVFFYS